MYLIYAEYIAMIRSWCDSTKSLGIGNHVGKDGDHDEGVSSLSFQSKTDVMLYFVSTDKQPFSPDRFP